jgi:hypothetical protein
MRVTVPVGNDNHQLDLQPAGTRDGRRVWTARCRLPMQGLLGGGLQVVRDAPKAATGAATRDMAPDAVAAAGGPVLLEGYASSTSMDWHGTEMTREALDSMARQMAAGVPYVPSHYDDEWEQVMGRTVDARVEQGTIIRDGATGSQAEGYRLAVRVELYPEHARSQQLMQAVKRGQVVGMSIGGWFTDAEVETNDRDEVERIYIKAVELDHLAVTRRPSNPDSWIAGLARSTGVAIAAARSEGGPAYLGGAVQGMDTRGMNVNVNISVCQHKNETEVEAEEAEAEGTESGDAMPYTDMLGGERDAAEKGERGTFMDAPNYRLSNVQTEVCNRCEHYTRDGWCSKFNFAAGHEYVCDAFMEGTIDHIMAGGNHGSSPATQEEADAESAERAVSGNTDLPLAPEDTAWGWDTDAANEVLGDPADWERYAMAHLWVDTENPERRASYKLPFAKIVNGELHIVFRGVAAAMGALNGARGGVDLPDADRPKVYERITALYQRFDKEPPELLRSGDTVLDNTVAQGSTANSQSDAVESAALSQTPSEDNAMTDNHSTATDTKRLDNLERAIGELNGVLSKLVERVAPTATTHTAPVADEAAQLRAQLEAKDAQLTRALAAASRQGVAHSPHAHRHTDVGGHGALIRSVERTLGGGSALVNIARSQAERRDATTVQTRAQLEADLRSLLAAAYADGIITDSMEG